MAQSEKVGRAVIELGVDGSRLGLEAEREFKALANRLKGAIPKDTFAGLDTSLTGRIKAIGAQFDGLATKLRNLGEKDIKAAFKSVDGAIGSFRNLAGEANPAVNAIENLSGKIGGAASAFAALGPVAGVAAVAIGAVTLAAAGAVVGVGLVGSELISLMEHAANVGDEMLALSNKTGLTVEALSELKFVSSQADVPLDAMTASIFKLGQNLAEGGDKAKAGLGKLGLSIADIRKQKPEEAFTTIITALGKIPDAGQRAAVGVSLFGKGFKEIAGLTREDMQGLIDQAHKLGLVMSTEFAVAGDRFNDALAANGAQIEALKLRIGSSLLPVGIAFVELFGQNLTAALAHSGTSAESFGEIMGNVAITVGQYLAQIIGLVADLAQTIAIFASGKGLEAMGLIDFFGSVTGAIAAVLSGMALLNPSLEGAASKAESLAAKIHGFAESSAKGILASTSAIVTTTRAISAAADLTVAGLPGKVAAVKKEIAATAEELRKAAAAGKGFGGGIGEGLEDVKKATKEVEELTGQIDRARSSGMSSGEIIRLFGKKALDAADDAARAGVSITATIEDVATAARQLSNAEFLSKVSADLADGSRKIFEAGVAARDKEQQAQGKQLVELATANKRYQDDLTRINATGVERRLLDIQRAEDAEIARLPARTAANAREYDIRRAQIESFYQHEADVAAGTYETIVERMRAAGVATRGDLLATAAEAARDYEQMRASGQFTSEQVQGAWERSLKLQAEALGGFKGGFLSMYADLAGHVSDALAQMLTHWRSWRDSLKSLWSDIAGDFTAMLARMLKQWIEGFLMKLLGSLTGMRGSLGTGLAGLLGGGPGGGGGGGGLGGLLGGLFGGGGGSGAVPFINPMTGLPMAGIGLPGAGGAGGAGAFAGLSGLLGGVGAGGSGLLLGLLGKQLFGGAGVGAGLFGGGSGAATGALIGSIVPGIGTAIGALIGGLSGFFSGFFGKSKSDKTRDQFIGGFGPAGTGEGSGFMTLAGRLTEATGEAGGGTLFDRLIKAKTLDQVKSAIDAINGALDAYDAKQKQASTTTDAEVEKQKAKYEELKATITDQIKSIDEQVAQLNASEAPEEHMGVIERQTRATLEAQRKALEAQLDAATKAAANAAQEAQDAGENVLDALGDQVAQFPEDMGDAAREGAIRFRDAFLDGIGGIHIPTLHVPVVTDLPVTPMAAGGAGRVYSPTLFLAGERGPEDFAFSGGGKRFSRDKPVNVFVTIQALDGADVERVVNSARFTTAIARRLPIILTDNPEGVRSNAQRALGIRT
jgi:hypothetical protein